MVIEQNYYFILGLMPGSSPAEIKARYRQLAKQYHPDCHGQRAGYEEKLRDLNIAYAFLSDPARKADYDAQVGPAFNPARAPQTVLSDRPVTTPAYLAYQPRSKSSLGAAVGLTMFLLISTGLGVLCTADASPYLAGFFPQAARTANIGTEFAGPGFSFLPDHGTFDNPNSMSLWNQPAPH